MKKLIFSLFMAFIATTALWASNVITYTATEKLPEVTTDGWAMGLHINAFNVAITSHEFSNGIGTITFAGEVTTIGDYAFEYCSSLTSVTIPNSVTTIGEHAFADCSDLTSVTIPNSVTTIGDYAFEYCTGLTSVTIGNSVTTIGSSAFGHCEGLTSVTIPNSVESIGWWAFSSCSGLTFPLYNATIFAYMPESYSGAYTIPDGINQIAPCAFSSCSGLTSVTIPNYVTTIGDYAFSNCTRLTSITIPNSVTTIGDGAFYNVNNIVYNGTATGSPWGAKCVNGYVDGYLIYSDASKTKLCGCFTAATGEIIIPNSVTSIGDYAFYECSGLTSVTIPNSVTTIGDYAFSGCSGLTSVTIGNSVTTIGDYAFSYCDGLTSVTIGYSVTTIGSFAFSGCSGLTSITIPNSVTTIGNNVFHYVNNIVYNGTATGSPWGAKCVNGYVDGNLVYNDASKTTLCGCSSNVTGEFTIPNSVTTIGDLAFSYCSGLTSVTIPNSVTTIGIDAFNCCTSLPVIDNLRYADTYLIEAVDRTLSTYTIKEGTKWIGSYALCGCSSLTSITIPNSVTTIGYAAFAWCALTSVIIPNSVTEIEEGAFNTCRNLTSVTIPNSVTTIGSDAFAGCEDLTSITIPNSVKTIGSDAFLACRGLTSVVVHWTDVNELPVIGSDAFRGIANEVGPSAATLHVPAGTKSIYQTAEQWEEFGTIVSDTPTSLPNVLMNDAQPTMHKVLHKGQILLERNNATYTLMGQKVK